jgi:hypothetical protein
MENRVWVDRRLKIYKKVYTKSFPKLLVFLPPYILYVRVGQELKSKGRAAKSAG